MRSISLFCTVLVFGSGLGLVGCHQQLSFINGDDVAVLKRDASEAAQQCNSLEQHGQPIVLTGSRFSAPAATGGTIEDGTYVLTSSILYTREKPHGARLLEMGKTTMVVEGTMSQLVRTDGEERERRTTVKRSSSGTTTTLETVCTTVANQKHATESTSTSYTASPSQFQFITPSPAGTVVATYTRL